MRPDGTALPHHRFGGLFRFGALARHNLVLLGSDPGQLVAYLVMPMALMLIQAPMYRAALRGLGAGAGTTQVVIGPLVMFSLLSLAIVGNAILAERTWRTWDRLRATPAGAAELLAGKALPALGVLIVQQAVLLGFGIVALGLRPAGSPVLIGLAVLVWGLTLLACGSALATLVRSHGQLSAGCDIGALVVSCLGGALAPPAAMPGWAREVAPVSPGYWAMGELRAALNGDTAGTLRAAAVLLGLALLAGTVACLRVRRSWTRGRLL